MPDLSVRPRLRPLPRRWMATVGAALALTSPLLPVPAAQASTVVVDGSRVVLGDLGSERNLVLVNWGNNPSARPLIRDDGSGIDAIGEGCSADEFENIYCDTSGQPSFALLLGAGNDVGESINSMARGTRTSIFGEEGNDVLESDAGADLLNGGPGNDRLVPDREHPRPGDRVVGGPGTDLLDLSGIVASRVYASLDGKANDGTSSRGDNYGRDLENVVGARDGRNRLVGSARANVLTGRDQADVLVGRGGRDRLLGGAGNDRLDARDGKGGDRVNCGSGRDIALVDRGDIVARRTCERVVRRR